MSEPARGARRGRRRFDLGRAAAVLLAVVLGILGAAPLALGLLVRTDAVRTWAAREVTRVLEAEFGTRATFDVHVDPWPLGVTIERVVVEGDDGAEPFLRAERIGVRPRLFSLLAGKLDAGAIEIVGARARVVVRGGELVSLRPTLPASSAPADDATPPLSSVALTDATIELDVDGTRATLRELDVDVLVEASGAIELAARAGGGALSRVRPVPGRPNEDAADEDRLCRFEARAEVRPRERSVLVRRLTLDAVVDVDPELGTRPPCELPADDWRKLSVELGAVRVAMPELATRPAIEGRVALRAPAPLVHRFVDAAPITGAVRLDAEVRWPLASEWPSARGHVHVERAGFAGRVFADRFDAELDFDGRKLLVTGAKARWSDGEFSLPEVALSPFEPGIPIEARNIAATDVELEGLLRDLSAHPEAWVRWHLASLGFERFGGTLAPLALEGTLRAETHGFMVFDRPAHRDDRVRRFGVERAKLEGTFAVREDGVHFDNFRIDTPRSHLAVNVLLGYGTELGIDVATGSYVDFAELSPIASLELGGRVELEARGTGRFTRPRIEGRASIEGFSLAGLSVGDVRTVGVTFEPFALELAAAEIVKGESLVVVPSGRIDFDAGADVAVEAQVSTTREPSLRTGDLLDVFGANKPPLDKFEAIARGDARVRFTVGGRRDPCGEGTVEVDARLGLDRAKLLGERFEQGAVDAHLHWTTPRAGVVGLEVEVPTLVLRDGPGSVIGSARVDERGRLRGDFVGSGLPLERLEFLGGLRPFLDGEASVVGELEGTLEAMRASLDLAVGPVRFGTRKLPASRLDVRFDPGTTPSLRSGRCPRRPEPTEERPPTLVARGGLFDQQITFDPLTVTIGSTLTTKGRVAFDRLDVGTILGGLPRLVYDGPRPEARVSGTFDMDRLEDARLDTIRGTATLTALEAALDGRRLALIRASGPIVVRDGNFDAPEHALVVSDDAGLRVAVKGAGRLEDAFGARNVNATVEVEPFDLAELGASIPSAEQLAGTLGGRLAIVGSLDAPRLEGSMALREGRLAVAGFPLVVEQAVVDVDVRDGEARITRGAARMGGGAVGLSGRIPLEDESRGTGDITIRGVRVPVDDGITLIADADLALTLPSFRSDDDELPRVEGGVDIVSFEYTRPLALSLDLGALTRGAAPGADAARSPDEAAVAFAVRVVASGPLVVRNDLADVRLEVAPPGILLSGTNVRYGARGSLKIQPDSKLRLRNHEFEVREGWVRFDDPEQIRADIDVRAQTEVRRYASSQPADASATSTTTTSATGGIWRVGIRAHGTTDDLQLDLSSDPALDREDVLLLLAMGMTRAEIDRGLATSLGQTVGLEALSALTGADRAVKSVIPILDYFHFGSGYSARTGRTEPNVTIGKRLTDDVRASVTTTLTQRDVAATLEWRLRRGLTVQGAYDNNNDIGSILGNLGADLRWRLDFE